MMPRALGLIWLSLYVMIVAVILFGFGCLNIGKEPGPITQMIIAAATATPIWSAFRNEDLKRSCITYTLYESDKPDIRAIKVYNAGHTVVRDVRLHYATEPRVMMGFGGWSSDFESGIAQLNPCAIQTYMRTISSPAQPYAIVHVTMLNPGDAFVYELIAPWRTPLRVTDLKVSYEYGSNQGHWIQKLFSRVQGRIQRR